MQAEADHWRDLHAGHDQEGGGRDEHPAQERLNLTHLSSQLCLNVIKCFLGA